ncbi:MAG: hypothetical protein GPJ54_02250 [Candidatus Heimdallarchaeota archaeon]|nr:hypothetical protein [Candidatus Heimdallarchaeota archaeon]
MYRTADEINHAIKKCIYDLFEVALFDGRITEDEQAILDQVKLDFENLEKTLVDILKSDLGEEEFQRVMVNFLKDAVEHASNVAREDDLMTEDEKFLISIIQQFIEELGATAY